jgi:hypothetical protein
MSQTRSMTLDSPIWQRRLHGEVVFHETTFDGSEVGRAICQWRPSYQLSCELPEWFQLSLECVISPDGFRRFTPIGALPGRSEKSTLGLRYIEELGGLVAVAAAGGATILADRGVTPKGHLLTYREAWLVQEHTRHRNEFIGDSRQLLKELRICAKARIELSQRSILPCDLGVGASGSGQPWSMADVQRAGLEAARAMSIEAPDQIDVVRLGLFEATKVRPVRLSRSEIQSIVRQSLFVLTPAVSRSQLAYVTRHILSSLAEILEGDLDSLTRWIEDRETNQLHKIEKLNECPMERDQVRAAIIELGWRATVMMAECVDAQFRVFRDALQEPLTPSENVLFEQTFLMNRSFYLPLVILHDRIEFLREAILNLWMNPDDGDALGAVHGMLYVYASMIEKRREADRRYKRHAGNKGREVMCLPGGEIEQLVSSVSRASTPTPFAEIALRVAASVGYGCDFDDNPFEAYLLETQIPQCVAFRLICANTSFDETITVSRSQFDDCARATNNHD